MRWSDRPGRGLDSTRCSGGWLAQWTTGRIRWLRIKLHLSVARLEPRPLLFDAPPIE